MKFSDFELRAWVEDSKHLRVMVHNSPAGAMRSPETVRFEAGRLEEIRELVEERTEVGARRREGLIKAGKLMAKALLPMDVNRLLCSSLARVGEEGLRVRLCLDEPLIDAPWEFLYLHGVVEREAAGFLALDSHISLVREPPSVFSTIQPSSSRQRMVILGAYQSDGGDPWQVRHEYERIQEALEPVAEYLVIDEEFKQASGDWLASALMTTTAIFHYSGHVHIDGDKGQLVQEINGQVLRDGLDVSNMRMLPRSNILAMLLSGARTRLAAFSACNSGRWPFVAPLLSAGLPSLIGVHGNVMSHDAISFFQKLYATLAIGLSLDEAVMYARQRLCENELSPGTESFEWGAFMTYMPATQAVLLPKPQDHEHAREQQQAVRDEAHQGQKKALRKAIVSTFSKGDLNLLCADIEEDLKLNGKDYEVNLEMVGGGGKETQVLNLIEYLENRSCLGYMIKAVRLARPGMNI